jgi:hypothetical protein
LKQAGVAVVSRLQPNLHVTLLKATRVKRKHAAGLKQAIKAAVQQLEYASLARTGTPRRTER